MLRNILVASDLGAGSTAALAAAARFARTEQSSLLALTVKELPDRARRWDDPLFSEELVMLRATLESIEDKACELLARQATLAAGGTWPGKFAFRWGSAARQIAEEAGRMRADVVVVGGVAGGLGAVTAQLLRLAPCPVLIVPAGLAGDEMWAGGRWSSSASLVPEQGRAA